MTALYCEIDPFAAAWLRGLIDAGHIAPGVVTETPLQDLYPHDLLQYDQVHLCAGIAVWSYALRRIGWPDHRRIWSASFPCQPFSAAGKGLGFADERHLWPYGLHLIQQCRPDLIVGEQVASKDGLAWLDVVFADLEASGYAVWAVDLCAAGVGAPHIRQRTWWFAKRLADTDQGQRGPRRDGPCETGRPHGQSTGRSDLSWLGHDDDARLEGHRNGHQAEVGRDGAFRPIATSGEFGGVAHTNGRDASTEWQQRGGEQRQQQQEDDGVVHVANTSGDGWREQRTDAIGGGERSTPEGMEQRLGSGGVLASDGRPGPVNGLWSDADWLFCRDNKWRPVEPGSFPLAHGLPRSMAALGPELSGLAQLAGLDGKSLARAKAHRVGTLKGYGNAIVASAAEEFLRAALMT